MAKDKYDQTLSLISNGTRDQSIRWELTSPSHYRDFILNADHVRRAFRASWEVGEKSFTIVFVEKRHRQHDEYGESFESIQEELFIIDQQNQLVLQLFDGLVDRDDLHRLGEEILDSNHVTREFFKTLGVAG